MPCVSMDRSSSGGTSAGECGLGQRVRRTPARHGLAAHRHATELPPRPDARELGEDLPQVPFDGVLTEEKLRTDLVIREPSLARRAICASERFRPSRSRGREANLVTGGRELAAGTLGESVGPKRSNMSWARRVWARASWRLFHDAATRRTRTVRRQMDDDAGVLQSFDRFVDQPIRGVVIGEQCLRRASAPSPQSVPLVPARSSVVAPHSWPPRARRRVSQLRRVR